jgi:putative hydrolase of the HAD superfamily
MARAVLFDLYDTLVRVDIPSVIMDSRRRIATTCDVDVERFLTLWNEHLPARTLGSLGSLEDEIRVIVGLLRADGGAGPVDNIVLDEQLVADLAIGDRAAWASAAQTYADAHETLRTLRERGFSLAMVSNCSCQATDVIRATQLDRHMDAMALSFELGVAKPDPGIFLAACERLGVSPGACVFVADGAGGELEAARALGMFAVWVERPGERRRNPEPPAYDARVEQIADVVNLDVLQRPLRDPVRNPER